MALLAVGSGCAPRGSGNRAPHVDRNVITEEQILEHRFTNAYEAVEALRSNWLLSKGPDSFSKPSEVVVYLDDTRLGGVQTLRTVATTSVRFIRYFDGLTASARWGLDHGQGVIFVSTHGPDA